MPRPPTSHPARHGPPRTPYVPLPRHPMPRPPRAADADAYGFPPEATELRRELRRLDQAAAHDARRRPALLARLAALEKAAAAGTPLPRAPVPHDRINAAAPPQAPTQR